MAEVEVNKAIHSGLAELLNIEFPSTAISFSSGPLFLQCRMIVYSADIFQWATLPAIGKGPDQLYEARHSTKSCFFVVVVLPGF